MDERPRHRLSAEVRHPARVGNGGERGHAGVFENRGDTSATGVAFTRDRATGEKVFYGEYLINAQGEDVVAGVRTPHPIADLAKEMPAAHNELMKVRAILEKHFKDMQDLEFTVEENRLYILQTR